MLVSIHIFMHVCFIVVAGFAGNLLTLYLLDARLSQLASFCLLLD